MTQEERDRAVSDLIELVLAIDGILQRQAQADASYFVKIAGRAFREEEAAAIVEGVLNAYRWQYIVSGIQDGRFMGVLTSMLNEQQAERIASALAPLM
jgi:hypothetical protein